MNPCYTFTQQDENKFTAMGKMEKQRRHEEESLADLQPRERAQYQLEWVRKEIQV